MPNPWKALLGILPQDVDQVGQITTVLADGMSVVALVGGGSITATGDGYQVGDPVWVKGGIIRGRAPSLSPVDVEV